MLTKKQEAFCLAYLVEPDASAAYRKAYNAGKMSPEAVWVAASRVLANAKVALRVKELRQPVVERARYGLNEAMDECAAAIKLATETENPAALVSAIALRSKLNGLLVDRKEVRTGPLDAIPDEDVDAALAAVQAIIAKAKATA